MSSIDVETGGFDAEAVRLNGASANDDVEPAGAEVNSVSLGATVACDGAAAAGKSNQSTAPANQADRMGRPTVVVGDPPPAM